jgi:hypothetical protein
MRSLRAGPPGRHARSGCGFRTRHALTARHALGTRHGVAGHAVTARHGVAGRARAARHGVSGPRRLPRAHVIAGRYRRAARTVRSPGGARRVHARLVARTWRRRSRPSGRWPVLTSSASWRARAMPSLSGRSRERRSLASASGDETARDLIGVTQDLRDGLAVRRGRGVAVSWCADQAAGRVHVRGVQHGRAAGTRPAAARVTITRGGGPATVLIPAASRRVRSRGSGRPGGPGRRRGLPAGGFPAVPGRGWPGPRLPCVPAPSESEDHQDHQSEGGSGRDHVQAHPGQVGGRERRMLGDVRHGHAGGEKEGAEHDRRGSRDRQDGDEAHPPGRGGFRAHWSTIASRLAPRKPNGQVRPLRTEYLSVTAQRGAGTESTRRIGQ